jgi:hypothetical protein
MRLYLVIPFFTFAFISSLTASEFYRSDREARKKKDQKEAFLDIKSCLERAGNVYDPEPTPDEPLRPERYLNDYWRAVKNKSEKERADAIEMMDDILQGEWFHERVRATGYALWRLNTRAAMDVDPLYPRNRMIFYLNYPIRNNDCSLISLLLERYPSQPEQASIATDGIAHARTVKMAQLLLAAGADVSRARRLALRLLHLCAEKPMCEPALISLYLSKGLSIFDVDDFGQNPLHHLARTASDHSPEQIKEKCAALFEGLCAADIVKLCTTKHREGCTPLDPLCELFEKPSILDSFNIVLDLTSQYTLYELLKKRLADAQSSLAPAQEAK